MSSLTEFGWVGMISNEKGRQDRRFRCPWELGTSCRERDSCVRIGIISQLGHATVFLFFGCHVSCASALISWVLHDFWGSWPSLQAWLGCCLGNFIGFLIPWDSLMSWNPDDAEVRLESDVIDLIHNCYQNALSRLMFWLSDRCTCHLTIHVYAACGMEVSYPCPTWDDHIYCPQLSRINVISWLVSKVLLL